METPGLKTYTCLCRYCASDTRFISMAANERLAAERALAYWRFTGRRMGLRDENIKIDVLDGNVTLEMKVFKNIKPLITFKVIRIPNAEEGLVAC